MDLEFWCAVLTGCILLIVLVICDSRMRYKSSIQKGELISFFPSWINTRKPLIWFISWCVIEGLVIPCFIIFSILGGSVNKILGVFILSTVPFLIIYQIFYHVIINVLKSYYKRK